MAHLTYIVLLFMLSASGTLYFRKPSPQQAQINLQNSATRQQVYIVSVNGTYAHVTTHTEVLNQVLDKGRNAPDALIYSYKESFTGFAARLTDNERKKLQGIKGVLGVEPSRNYELYTTRSWDFLGFPVNVNRAPGNTESNLIIGVIDSGIWPNSASFNDFGLGPRPAKWKGVCQDIFCNNKIIGAQRYYTGKNHLLEPFSVVDTIGHGTHAASIAAGRVVPDSSFSGFGLGTARGGVPSARIAVYKVCWTTDKGVDCPEQDMLKAVEDATTDGVDIISASLGYFTTNYSQDSLAVGSFRAMKKGILMVAAGGNAGPDVSTIANAGPWVLTVAASTIDRKFEADLEIGTGEVLKAENINSFPDQEKYYKLVIAQNLRNGSSSIANQINVNAVTDFTKENVDNAIRTTNPRGVIAAGDNCPYDSPSFPLPGVCLNSADGARLRYYMTIVKQPIGKIKGGRAIQVSGAPVIARSSSRGPNPTAKDILKPDISAPGVNILAAWPTNVKPSDYYNDQRSSPFNFQSGTSMACPHISAIAVYIKSFQPTWSPATIKSAIMTTATPMSPAATPEAEFAYGSGQLNPIRALSPGLVYDATDKDYLKFLCAERYSEGEVKLISGDKTATCRNVHGFYTRNLNYPSMSARIERNRKFTVTFKRTVTNVEARRSVYTANVVNNPTSRLDILVEPAKLSFSSLGEKRDFSVIVYGTGLPSRTVASAALVWKDGFREVRSPILIYTRT